MHWKQPQFVYQSNVLILKLVLKSLSLKFNLFEIMFLKSLCLCEKVAELPTINKDVFSWLVAHLLVYWYLEDDWARPHKQMWLSKADPSSTWACVPCGFWSSRCHSHSALQRAAFPFPCFHWLLPGMEWACLSPKCKCHFSTSLVTTPFLAFIGNDIFLCSLSPTHAAGRQGQLLCFKWLERKCRDL